MAKTQENARDYHLRRETEERMLAVAAKNPRVAHSHIVMAERHRLFAIDDSIDEATAAPRGSPRQSRSSQPGDG